MEGHDGGGWGNRSSSVGVEEEIERGNAAVLDRYEIGPGIGGPVSWPARDSPKASRGPLQFFGLADRSVGEIRVHRPDGTRDLVDFRPAAVDAIRTIEDRVFSLDLFDDTTAVLGSSIWFLPHAAVCRRQCAPSSTILQPAFPR